MGGTNEDLFSKLTYVALGIALAVCVWAVFSIIDPDAAGLSRDGIDWDKWATVTNAGAAAAMVVLTILLVRFTRRQADATTQSVDAMRQSVSQQNERERRELRAYVGLKDGLIDFTDVSKLPTVNVEIINTGLTPAKEAVHRFEVQFGILMTSPSLMPVTVNEMDPRSVILPRGVLLGQKAIALDDQQLEWMSDANSGWTLYAYGEIEYIDIYERRQKTQYRLAGKATKGEKARLYFCPEGNAST